MSEHELFSRWRCPQSRWRQRAPSVRRTSDTVRGSRRGGAVGADDPSRGCVQWTPRSLPVHDRGHVQRSLHHVITLITHSPALRIVLDETCFLQFREMDVVQRDGDRFVREIIDRLGFVDEEVIDEFLERRHVVVRLGEIREDQTTVFVGEDGKHTVKMARV